MGTDRSRSLREPARIRLDGRDCDRIRREEGRPGLVAAIANGNAIRRRVADRSENDSSVRARTAHARCRPHRNARRLSPASCSMTARSRSIVIRERIRVRTRRGNSKPRCPSRTRALFPATCADACCCAAITCSTFTCRERSADRAPAQPRRSPSPATIRDDPWPLTPDDGSVRAFFAASRNFFTGALSPGIGKISNVPSFYSAAALPRSSYTLWAFAAVDGSLHLVDGMTDQAIRGAKWGSDLAAVHSSCGTGTQLLVSESGDTERDGLRAFEIPDRDPVAVSSAVEFDGRIVALWPESSGNGATAIVRRKDTGWYEAYRVSISCGN